MDWCGNLPFDKAEKCPSSSECFDNQSHTSIGFDGDIFATVKSLIFRDLWRGHRSANRRQCMDAVHREIHAQMTRMFDAKLEKLVGMRLTLAFGKGREQAARLRIA